MDFEHVLVVGAGCAGMRAAIAAHIGRSDGRYPSSTK